MAWVFWSNTPVSCTPYVFGQAHRAAFAPRCCRMSPARPPVQQVWDPPRFPRRPKLAQAFFRKINEITTRCSVVRVLLPFLTVLIRIRRVVFIVVRNLPDVHYDFLLRGCYRLVCYRLGFVLEDCVPKVHLGKGRLNRTVMALTLCLVVVVANTVKNFAFPAPWTA